MQSICDSKYCSEGKHVGGGSYVCPHNNLAIWRPDLIVEFHPNNTVLITSLSTFSGKMMMWRCSNPNKCCDKHVWFATVANRTNQNSGCPYCCNQKICPCKSLAAIRPDLVA